MTPLGVRRSLKILGWNQCEAARQLGCDERTIRRWLKTGASQWGAAALRQAKRFVIAEREGIINEQRRERRRRAVEQVMRRRCLEEQIDAGDKLAEEMLKYPPPATTS